MPRVGERVECTVEKIFPFGVFARLDNGAPAFIRRRELTLAGDIDPRRALVDGRPLERGRRLRAAVSRPAGAGKLELSVRATLRDPWLDFPDYPPNTVVSAAVRQLYPDGVQVEIVPGVLGFIPLAELRATPPARPEELLRAGDHVKAVITHIDRPGRRVSLSLRRLLAQQTVVQSLMAHLATGPDAPPPLFAPTAAPPVLLDGPVLVLEDHRELREPLVRWLRDQGCGAYGVASAAEALALCAGQSFALTLVDLDMPEVDGLTFIDRLRAANPHAPVAVMSGPDLLAHHWATLRARGVVAAFDKPLEQDDIRRVLERLAAGETPHLGEPAGEDAPPPELARLRHAAAVSRRGPIERIRLALDDLVRETRADRGAVFHFDRAARAISLVAEAGRGSLDPADLYGLLGSPVKDVIVENRPLWENDVAVDDARFRKLLDVIPCRSCVALPLEAGGRVDHALFVFGGEPYHFTTARLAAVMATGPLARAALETQLFDERVRAESPFILSGHLASTLGHELFSTVSGLDLTLCNLRADLSRQTVRGEPADLKRMGADLAEAGQMAEELKNTVREFQRLMRVGQEGLVDVNRVLRQAQAQSRPLAVRRHVRLALEAAEGLPPVRGNEIRLLHVFLNLILNAVQHIAEGPDAAGEVRLLTALGPARDARPVKVRFADTGPGIHRERWEEVFELGYTTREEGHGLGLYIARDAVEKMDGRISVEESFMALGTTFLVELPAAVE